MLVSIFDNDYIKIIIVFVMTIGFLCLFAFFASLATFFAKKNKFRKMDEKDKTSRQAKIYELIYSKSEMSKEDFKEYFNCDISFIEKDLDEMCNNNIIKNENNKYYLNR